MSNTGETNQIVTAIQRVNSTLTGGITATIAAGDIEIGAVELKNASTDDRASITAANTARTTGTLVLAVQTVDATGNVQSATPVLGAGSSIVGKVGIDQTTPGTTNGVVVNSGTLTTLSTLTSGNVGGFTTIVSSTPVMSVAGAYATGDYMGTTTTPQAFTSAVRTSGGTGIVTCVTISDKITTANVAMELWLFSATFTAPTDNAAWAISDAEALTVLGVIPIVTTKWYASSNNQVYVDDTISIGIKPAATSLFYALVARGTTPAFTSADLTINLTILQD